MNEEPHNLFSLYGEEKNPVIPKQPTSSFKDTGREVWREEKRNALCAKTLLIFLHTLSSFKFFWSPIVYQKQKTNKQKQNPLKAKVLMLETTHYRTTMNQETGS